MKILALRNKGAGLSPCSTTTEGTVYRVPEDILPQVAKQFITNGWAVEVPDEPAAEAAEEAAPAAGEAAEDAAEHGEGSELSLEPAGPLSTESATGLTKRTRGKGTS